MKREVCNLRPCIDHRFCRPIPTGWGSLQDALSANVPCWASHGEGENAGVSCTTVHVEVHVQVDGTTNEHGEEEGNGGTQTVGQTETTQSDGRTIKPVRQVIKPASQ